MAFQPGQSGNPGGKPKGSDIRRVSIRLRKAIERLAKAEHDVTLYQYLAAKFFESNKMMLAILPYIAPKLKALEISGEVQVPFQFNVFRSDGKPVELPKPVKQIESNVVVTPIKLASSRAGTKAVKSTTRRSTQRRSTKKAVRNDP